MLALQGRARFPSLQERSGVFGERLKILLKMNSSPQKLWKGDRWMPKKTQQGHVRISLEDSSHLVALDIMGLLTETRLKRRARLFLNVLATGGR